MIPYNDNYQQILLDIMINNNYWFVDIEARAIHLKNKELQDT